MQAEVILERFAQADAEAAAGARVETRESEWHGGALGDQGSATGSLFDSGSATCFMLSFFLH